MADILVIYWHQLEYPMRVSLATHLTCFNGIAGHRVCYVNLAFHGIPRFLREWPFDLIVFHSLFTNCRGHTTRYAPIMKRAEALRDHPGVKILLPQDEYSRSRHLCDMIRRLDVTHVFSLAEECDWPVIYKGVDFSRVVFHRVLPGYLDDRVLTTIERLSRTNPAREVDIGYRARPGPVNHGRHGRLKSRLTDEIAPRAAAFGLQADVSNRPEDTFYGDDWFRFLLRCKYVVGVEGGASVLDEDGMLAYRVLDYQRAHPQAGFDEIEAACFPGKEGEIRYRAISPRHLECCATRTCQILVEGSYNGILKPGQHYIELKKDFSNLDDVLRRVKADAERAVMVDNAYRDIVASGRYSYSAFVQDVIAKALAQKTVLEHAGGEWRFHVAAGLECISLLLVVVYARCVMPLKKTVKKWIR